MHYGFNKTSTDLDDPEDLRRSSLPRSPALTPTLPSPPPPPPPGDFLVMACPTLSGVETGEQINEWEQGNRSMNGNRGTDQ